MCPYAASQQCCLAPWSDCPSSATVSVVVELHWEVLSKLCGGFLAASFGSMSCTSSPDNSLWFPPQHPELDHQLPPHEISTRRSTWPKSALKTLTPCYHVLAKNELVCEPLVDTTFEKLGEHEWRNGVQNLNARVTSVLIVRLQPEQTSG